MAALRVRIQTRAYPGLPSGAFIFRSFGAGSGM